MELGIISLSDLAADPEPGRPVAALDRLDETLAYARAADELGLDEEGLPFHVKKEVTSALRRLAPIGLSTDIVWTANVRTLRHVIEMRTAEGAEEELRQVFDKVAEAMCREAPDLFQDSAARAAAPGSRSNPRADPPHRPSGAQVGSPSPR